MCWPARRCCRVWQSSSLNPSQRCRGNVSVDVSDCDWDGQASETLLQRMTALYVASHYRNTPNDLQLAADAPAHALFVLLGPVEESANVMPDILAAVQVGLEHQDHTPCMCAAGHKTQCWSAEVHCWR